MGRKSRAKQSAANRLQEAAASSTPAVAGAEPLRDWRPAPLDVILVAVAALAMRLLYLLLYRDSLFYQVPVVDASTFHIWAQALREGRELLPDVYFKPPLYPHLLAFFYGIFGVASAPIYALQAVLGVVTSLLCLILGRYFFAPRVALSGALAYALLPIPVFLEFQLLAESWTTMLSVLALVVLAGLDPGGRRFVVRAALAGLLLGIAALGRPNLLILPPVFALWLWWNQRPSTRPAVASVALLIGTLVAISPATLHNLSKGELVLVSANAGANFWAGIRPEADGVSAIPIGIQWDDLQLQCEEAGVRGASPANRYLIKRSLTAGLRQPLRSLGLTAKKTILLTNVAEGRNNIGAAYLAREEGVVVLRRWWPGWWLLAPFALLGLALSLWPQRCTVAPPERRPTILLLYLAALALAVLPFFVNARFRAPLLPVLALFAAHGFWTTVVALRSGNRRAAFCIVAILVTAFVLVNVDWFGVNRADSGARDVMNLAAIQAKGRSERAPDLAAAQANFERAMRLDPDDPDIPERYGLNLQSAAYRLLQIAGRARQGGRDASRQETAARAEFERARRLHERAATLFPRSYRSYGSIANCRITMGQIDAEQARVALALADTTAARSLAISAAEQLRAGLRAWQSAVRLKRDLPTASASAAAARESLRKLPDLAPEITAAKQDLGR